MMKYTTGEIAGLCGVSVRTVQYYDSRGILTPSELSEGGRRLYSEDDLKRLRIICFLRDADVSINKIGDLLNEKDPESVIFVLLEQQEQLLRDELLKSREKLAVVEGIKKELKTIRNFSLDSIGDIAHAMENKKNLKRVDNLMLLTGILVNVIAWTAVVLWILTLNWWLLGLGVGTFMLYEIWAAWFYAKRVSYICPACHRLFKPRAMENILARHSPAVGKMTCTCCGHKGFCVKTYAKEGMKNE